MTPAGNRTHDAVVVLGAVVRNGQPSRALAERIAAGVAAWRAGRAPWLVLTGRGQCLVMKRHAVALGADPAAVLVDDTARSTRENATASAVLLQARGLTRVLLVTQAFHRRRSVAVFRRVGLIADALEFSGRRASGRETLREWTALVWYAARRWI